MRLSLKLSLASLMLAVLSISATSVAGLYLSASQSTEAAVAKLETLADGRRNELAQYLRSVEEDVRNFGEEKVVVKALDDLSAAFGGIEGDRTAELQGRYIDGNPAAEGSKSELKSAGKDKYDQLHGRYHGFFQRYAEEKGYEDILLVNLNGDIVYSLMKHRDFAGNLSSEGLKNTGLAKVFASAAPSTEKFVVFSDYENYAPSGSAAAFIAIPVASVAGKTGVLALRMPTGRIEAILNNRIGLGETGEAVLLNSGGYFLTNPVRGDGREILEKRIDPELVKTGAENPIVNATLADHRGEEGKVSAVGIDFLGARWTVAAVMDTSEVFAALDRLIRWTLAISLGVLALTAAIGLSFANRLARPISALVADMNRLAGGDTSIDCEGKERSDEIGDMARSVVVFRDAAVEKGRLQAEASRMRELAESERRQREEQKQEEEARIGEAVEALAEALGRLAQGDLTRRIGTSFTGSLDRLRLDYNSSVGKLAEALEEVRANTHQIRDDSGEMQRALDQLSTRTETQASSLGEAAAALAEMTQAVQSAARRATTAERLAADARQSSAESSSVMSNVVCAISQIEASSREIGNIIGVIDEIAFQTNLLALNAGVEAARAGETGKGFAVVAQEVRELAQRTAAAAREVKQLITKSAGEVARGASLVRATGGALDEIAAKVNAIDEEIKEIAQTARSQSTGIQEINITVTQLDAVTQQNAAMVEESSAVTHRLNDEASALAGLVGEFQIGTQAPLPDRRRREGGETGQAGEIVPLRRPA
ncbi:MAG: methyl-accepting chemotaxis protein [Shinella sp.]|nr:methyl-accepting chemotaxis protein [Shinella sp.]